MAPLISETLSSIGKPTITEDRILIICPGCEKETPASKFKPVRNVKRTKYYCPLCKMIAVVVVDPAHATKKEAKGSYMFGSPIPWCVQTYGGMKTDFA